MLARLYWGETPQTPLSVFNVGFAHDGGIPPTPPKIGGGPQNPPKYISICSQNVKMKVATQV